MTTVPPPANRERWLAIPGWKGLYEVSDLGRVRGVDRVVHDSIGRHRHLRGQIISTWVNRTNGRHMIHLKNQGRLARCVIAPLVLAAFVGPRPEGHEACHNDGDCLNDRLDNLRWDTRRENRLDTVRHERHSQVNKTHCPYGHLLVEPNLVRYRLLPKDPTTQPGRICLACQRGRSWPRGDRRATADLHYSMLMQEV